MNRLIEVDTSELVALISDLNNAAEVIHTGAANAVNRVADTTRKNTVLEITSQVNLTKPYVDRKVVQTGTATQQKPTATLEVSDENTFVTTYDGQQKTKSNVWTPAKYAATFGTLAAPVRLPSGKLAQWIPRKGDSLRGIRTGQKSAGISAQIHTGKGVVNFRHVFFMPVLSGKKQEGRWGAFTHHQNRGRLEPLYGPSAYQVTKGVWRDRELEIADALSAEVTDDVSAAIERAMRIT